MTPFGHLNNNNNNNHLRSTISPQMRRLSPYSPAQRQNDSNEMMTPFALHTRRHHRRRRLSFGLSPDSDETTSEAQRDEMVTLHIGRRTFKTTLATLRRAPYLLETGFVDEADGSYFIDRDGAPFQYLLSYLRTGFVEIPAEMMQSVAIESDFYQIPLNLSEALRQMSLLPLQVQLATKTRDEERLFYILINDKDDMADHCEAYKLTKEDVAECFQITTNKPEGSDGLEKDRQRAARFLRSFVQHLRVSCCYEINIIVAGKIYYLRPIISKTFMIGERIEERIESL